MQFFTTNISENAKKFIENVLNSKKLSEGEVVKEFEIQLQKKFNLLRKPATVNSGTSALHLSLAVAGIDEDDEVILPAQTFIATGLSILMQKAKPVFADIQPDTGNICPTSIKKKITNKTKAIMPVHWAGYPCDMDEISQLAKEYNLIVIEDAAHAIGAKYKDKFIGSISDFTIYSFQAIKHLTTGDGGAVCCLTEQNERELMKRRWFNIDREKDITSFLGERQYDAQNIGFKYHMNNLAASLGLSNLPDLDSILKRHKFIAEFYKKNLIKIPGIKLLKHDKDRESSHWIFTILVENRNNFVMALKERNIPTSIVHQRIDKNKIFGGVTPGLDGQEFFEKNQIALPVHTDLTDENLLEIIESIKMGW